MADSQQQAVYAWERQWRAWNTPSCSQPDARRVIRWAERLYRVPPVSISFYSKNKANGVWMPSNYHAVRHIALRPNHVNPAVALHETSHAITHHLFGWDPPDMEPHGPQWLGIYMLLLERLKVAPRVALESSARDYDLKWVGPGWIGPRKIRKRYRGAIRRARDFWE